MPEFKSFSNSNYVYLCSTFIVLIHWWAFGCFHLLAVSHSNTAMNMGYKFLTCQGSSLTSCLQQAPVSTQGLACSVSVGVMLGILDGSWLPRLNSWSLAQWRECGQGASMSSLCKEGLWGTERTRQQWNCVMGIAYILAMNFSLCLDTNSCWYSWLEQRGALFFLENQRWEPWSWRSWPSMPQPCKGCACVWPIILSLRVGSLL